MQLKFCSVTEVAIVTLQTEIADYKIADNTKVSTKISMRSWLHNIKKFSFKDSVQNSFK